MIEHMLFSYIYNENIYIKLVFMVKTFLLSSNQFVNDE